MANSDHEIETWEYTGPKQQSTCDNTIFDNFLGFGQTFKEGDRVRLDFYRDNDKYYCFRAINAEGTAGFGSHHVTDLSQPVIDFKQTKDQLTASLSSTAEASDYTANWQYILLDNKQAACSESIFGDITQITNSHIVALEPSDTDRYYCFRLQKVDADHVYRIGLVTAGDNAPAIISPLHSNNKLYLLADQEIKNWVVAPLTVSASCDNSTFADRDDYRLSEYQAAVINLDANGWRSDNYCIRVQNRAGIYSYQKYDTPTLTTSIVIQTDFSTPGRLSLTARSARTANSWQVRRAADLNSCRAENFDNLELVANRNSLTVGYPTERDRVYCWRTAIGASWIYAAYPIPAAHIMIGTYRDGDQINGHAFYQQLRNWEYINQPLSTTDTGHCSAVDFALGANSRAGQTIDFTKVERYCFRAQDASGGYYYGTWFTADLKLDDPQLEETKVILANNLNLSDLGRFILAQAQPKAYSDSDDLADICGDQNVACYAREDGRIHFLKSDSSGSTTDLERSLIEAARWNYLTPQQRAVLDFELLSIYYADRGAFNALLPAELYDNRLFETDFADHLYISLMTQPEGTLSNNSWQQSWLNWRRALFNEDE